MVANILTGVLVVLAVAIIGLPSLRSVPPRVMLSLRLALAVVAFVLGGIFIARHQFAQGTIQIILALLMLLMLGQRPSSSAS